MSFSHIPANKAGSKAFKVQVGLKKETIKKSRHYDKSQCMILQHNTMITWQTGQCLDYCCKLHPLITMTSLDPSIQDKLHLISDPLL